MNGDLLVTKFFPLFQLIAKTLEKMGNASGNVLGKVLSPQLENPSLSSSSHIP